MIDETVYKTQNTKVSMRETEKCGTLIMDERIDLFIFVNEGKVTVHTWDEDKKTIITEIPVIPFSPLP